ncbi:MAG: hypothetical protein Q8O56_14725 [Solirubrobacteraceae bacterium]|nr:hypothetical protein [Solirubrobacteraceae bacterium]
MSALVALVAAATTLGGAANALAADVESATLTWNVPHTTPAGGGAFSLAGYATSIGAGDVTVSGAGATGGPITSTSTPAPGAGVSYPFTFPGASTIGTFNPAVPSSSLAFTGTLTFTAHSSTFLKVIDPRMDLNAAGGNVVSIGIVAGGGGEVSPAMGSEDPTAAIPAGQRVLTLIPSTGTTTTNPDGSITMAGLGGATATGGLHSDAIFDAIRPFFADRPLNTFDVTFKTAGSDPDPDPPEHVSQTLPVTGTVDEALSLTLGQATASLGTFLPGVAQDYATTIGATVTSSGPATLSVADLGADAGFLTNGAAKLASPLEARAGNTATPAGAYSTISGTPATLLSYASATSEDEVTIGLRQSISASEPLTTGTYGKTLTFTVSATTP